VIKRLQLYDLLKKFPEVRKEMKSVATIRKFHNQKLIRKVIQQKREWNAQNGERRVADQLVEGEYVRMNSQKKEGEIIFEQLRLFQQNRDKKSILKEIIKQLESIKAASLDESTKVK
jgi:predicted RND superfamily exporter protein